jgi:hypothetical protein
MRYPLNLAVAFVAVLALTVGWSEPAYSCKNDFKSSVEGNVECLVIRAYGVRAEKTALVVFIHGDSGGDYFYHTALHPS